MQGRVLATAAAALLGLCGVAVGVFGVFLLAGAGWALVAGAVPMLLVSAALFRGLMRG